MSFLSGGNKELESLAEKESSEILDQASRKIRVIRDEKVSFIAKTENRTIHEVYAAALNKGILPYRYIRNHDSITIEEQYTLFNARVTIIGAGGLGGQVILNLARTGIGHLVIVDGDRFDESNLNRQALSRTSFVGMPKAKAAVLAIQSINPAVDLTAHSLKIDRANGKSILEGSDVIVDALDSVKDRFVLQDLAGELNIPLIHGAVAGYEGQVMTIFPGDTGLEALYGNERKEIPREDDPVAILGVPAVTPAIIASIQGMEVIKVLLNRGEPLRNRLARLDIEALELKKFSFK